MRPLAFDTSGTTASVALVEGSRARASFRVRRETGHDAALLQQCQSVLTLSGFELSRVELVAVGTGPGTFTGLRVGLATAKGLCLAAGLPLAGVSSLQVLAAPLAGQHRVAVAMVDAHKSQVYVAAYARHTDGQLLERLAPRCADPLEAGQLLLSLAGSPLLLCGSGARRYAESLIALLGDRAQLVSPFHDVVDAETLAVEAQQQLLRHGASDLAALQPCYVRPSDARKPG